MDAPRTSPAPADFSWDAARARWRILILGAGGARGRELTLALLSAGHPPERLMLHGRTRRPLRWRGGALRIEPLPESLPAAELAFLCLPPELAPGLARELAARGTRVIDLSGGLRTPEEGSLVLAEINGDSLGAFTDTLVLPRPSVALVAPALALLEGAAGLAEVDLFGVLAAASAGARGILALRGARAGAAPEPGARTPGELWPSERLRPGFEEGVSRELRQLLDLPELLLDASAWLGDVERCDAFSVKVLLHQPLEAEVAGELFARAPGLYVEPAPEGPEPARCTGSGRIHLGRIRPGSRGPRSLCFSAAGDQLRAGSSLAALRLAAKLPVAA